MQLRIIRLKNRKGKADLGSKLCKNCAKEYDEKDNLNWSCRQHQSSYGGEMWWCCGKKQKDALGCKFSKHEEKKEDEEDDENVDKEKNKINQMRLVKCQCCK